MQVLFVFVEEYPKHKYLSERRVCWISILEGVQTARPIWVAMQPFDRLATHIFPESQVNLDQHVVGEPPSGNLTNHAIVEADRVFH